MDKMRELYGKVAKSNELQKKLTRIANEAKEVGAEKTNQRLIKFAEYVGYDITIKEMQNFFTALAAEQSAELSDAELDMVAGGKMKAGLVISIFGVGLSCAVVSVGCEIQSGNCTEFLNQ